jgi:hypothetical protein
MHPETTTRDDDIPLACDLTVFTPEEREAHVALARQALLAWPDAREETPDGYLFHYQGDEARFLTLARFAAEEHRCCPWLRFSLQLAPALAGRPAGMRLGLHASAPGKAMLAAALRDLPAGGGG